MQIKKALEELNYRGQSGNESFASIKLASHSAGPTLGMFQTQGRRGLERSNYG